MADEAVMDVAVDTADVAVDTAQEQTDELAELGDGKIDGRKYTKEYREWLKTVKSDPVAGKHAKTAYNDHGRVLALQELDPKGIDGVRENYELLKSVGGVEGLQGLQSRLADVEAVDQAILDANPKVWEMLGEDFNEGLSKLGPSYLEHWAKVDSEGYSKALQPIMFGDLQRSELTQSLVGLEQVLLDKTLTPEQKLTKISESMLKVGEWYQTNKQLAENAKKPDAENPWKQKWEEREKQDMTQAEQKFWNEDVGKPLAAYENDQFSNLFKPYANRLKLDTKAQEKLRSDFKAELTRLGKSDKDYMDGINGFRASKKPNATAIQTFAKAAITRHAKEAFETALNDRYGFYLKTGKQNTGNGTRTAAPIAGKDGKTITPVVVSAKPDAKLVDWKAWNRLDSKQKYGGFYPLRDGRMVQVKRA